MVKPPFQPWTVYIHMGKKYVSHQEPTKAEHSHYCGRCCHSADLGLALLPTLPHPGSQAFTGVGSSPASSKQSSA